MQKILEKFKNNWEDLKNEEEVRIFQKFAEEGKLLTVLYSGKSYCN